MTRGTKVRQQEFPVLDQFDYHHKLEASDGLAITLFTKPSCASCQAWRRLLMQYKTFHPAVKIYQVDAEQDAALAQELEIFHLPALYLYINGKFHCQLQSEARISRFEAAMQDAILQPAQEAP
jgi:hypothetical protein